MTLVLKIFEQNDVLLRYYNIYKMQYFFNHVVKYICFIPTRINLAPPPG